MKIEKRDADKRDDESVMLLKQTMPLNDVKKVMFGLTPSALTYHGAFIVKVLGTGIYLRLNPAMTNYRSYRYAKCDVYTLRDCLIALNGSNQCGAMSVGSASDGFTNIYIKPIEQAERKKSISVLVDKLGSFLESRGYCMLANYVHDGEGDFGILLTRKATGNNDKEAVPLPD